MPDALAVLNKTSIDIGSFHSTVMSVLKGVLIFVAAVWMATVVGRFAESELHKSEDLTPSLKVLSSKLLRALFVLVALFIGMDALGIDFTALAFFSGAVGLGIGFGLQKIFANLISGVILLLDKSIKPGDVITVTSNISESFGQINYLAARYVSVVARDGREYLIPNEDLIINQVINWSYSDEYVRQDINFGTSYDSDPYLVRQLAVRAACSHARVVTDKKPVCHIVEFGDSSIRYILRFWIIDPEGGITNVKGDIYLSMWDLFKENDVKIPFPHRQLLIDPEIGRKLDQTR
jgi:small-conductance mechanosensitive channel